MFLVFSTNGASNINIYFFSSVLLKLQWNVLQWTQNTHHVYVYPGSTSQLISKRKTTTKMLYLYRHTHFAKCKASQAKQHKNTETEREKKIIYKSVKHNTLKMVLFPFLFAQMFTHLQCRITHSPGYATRINNIFLCTVPSLNLHFRSTKRNAKICDKCTTFSHERHGCDTNDSNCHCWNFLEIVAHIDAMYRDVFSCSKIVYNTHYEIELLRRIYVGRFWLKRCIV